jgi:hypothetical protein
LEKCAKTKTIGFENFKKWAQTHNQRYLKKISVIAKTMRYFEKEKLANNDKNLFFVLREIMGQTFT